jgi:hypothetical protein
MGFAGRLPPTDASPTSSRVPAHGSGPMWFAIPSSRWTCTTYSLPISRHTAQHPGRDHRSFQCGTSRRSRSTARRVGCESAAPRCTLRWARARRLCGELRQLCRRLTKPVRPAQARANSCWDCLGGRALIGVRAEAVAFNQIQFQHGMSIAEFLRGFGTEAQCTEAVKQARGRGQAKNRQRHSLAHSESIVTPSNPNKRCTSPSCLSISCISCGSGIRPQVIARRTRYGIGLCGSVRCRNSAICSSWR